MLELVNRGKALLRRSPLLKNSFLIFSSSAIAGLFAYAYNIYMARLLGPEAFGTVGALLSIYSLVFIASGLLASALTKFVATYNAEARPDKIAGLLSFSLYRALQAGGLSLLFFVIFSKVIAGFLRISSPLPVVIVGILCLIVAPYSVLQGVLRGLQAFRFLSLVAIIEAVARLAFGLGLAFFFWVSGALFAYGLAALMVTALSFIPLRPFLRRAWSEIDSSGLLRFSSMVMLVTLCYAAMDNLPIIFAKRYNTAEEAGLLVAVVSLGNIITSLTGALKIVLFPIAADLHTRGVPSRPTLARAMFLVALTSLSVLFGFWVLGEPLIILTYGIRYTRAIPFLPVYAVARALLAIAGLYTTYCLATDYRRGALVLLLPTGAQFVLLLVHHQTMTDILHVQLANGLFVLAVFAADHLLRLSRR